MKGVRIECTGESDVHRAIGWCNNDGEIGLKM